MLCNSLLLGWPHPEIGRSTRGQLRRHRVVRQALDLVIVALENEKEGEKKKKKKKSNVSWVLVKEESITNDNKKKERELSLNNIPIFFFRGVYSFSKMKNP